MEGKNKDYTTKSGRQIHYQLIDFNGEIFWAKNSAGHYAVDLQHEQKFLEVMDLYK